MVHRIDIKFYILEVDIWFVMGLESLFYKRAVNDGLIAGSAGNAVIYLPEVEVMTERSEVIT